MIRAYQVPGIVTSFIGKQGPEIVLEVQGADWSGIRGAGRNRGDYHSSRGIKETPKLEWWSHLCFTFTAIFA